MHVPTLPKFEAINSNEPKWVPPVITGVGGEMGSPWLWNDSLFDLHLARSFCLLFGAMPKSKSSEAFEIINIDELLEK